MPVAGMGLIKLFLTFLTIQLVKSNFISHSLSNFSTTFSRLFVVYEENIPTFYPHSPNDFDRFLLTSATGDERPTQVVGINGNTGKV